MTPDVKGLLVGAAQEPSSGGATQAGRRTADSPFAVLLASAAPGRAARAGAPASGAVPATAPTLDIRAGAAAVTPDLAATRAAGTDGAARPQAAGPSRSKVGPRAPSTHHVSEDEREATESNLLHAPAPVSASAGTGVMPSHPAAAAASLPLPTGRRLEAASASDRDGLPATSAGLARFAHPTAASAAPAVPGHAAPGPTAPSANASGLAASQDHHTATAPHPATAPPASTANGAAPTSTPAATAGALAAESAARATTPPPAAQAAPPNPTSPSAQASARGWRAASRADGPVPPAPPPPEPASAATPSDARSGQPSSPQGGRRDERARPAREDASTARPNGPATRAEMARAEASATTLRAPPPALPVASAPGKVVARELGTSARLTQSAHGGQSLRDAANPKAAATTRADGPVQPPSTQPPTAAPEASIRPAVSNLRGAPALPAEVAQALPGATILPNTAHLLLESDTLGDLSLHLRIRDGVAHVRVEGEQAGQLAGRGQELQRALAAEGLKLGRLEVEPQSKAPAAVLGDVPRDPRGGADQGAQGQRDRPEHDEPSPGAPTTASGAARRPAGRTTAHHVEA